MRTPEQRCASMVNAALIGIDFGTGDFQASLDELHLLTHSAGVTPTALVTACRRVPNAALFLPSGKADELKTIVELQNIDLVVFNHALTPAQQRNLERRLERRVVDRTTLILDIFAQRARSHEGKLQVELAQLHYLKTRLVRAWTHLERQKGGIGLRGPGETQLETDRRLIGKRIKVLKSRLDRVHRQHRTQRRQRARGGAFSVSLVGYTNAGKSTLFNALTRAQVYCADQLFATLDTTSRRFYLSHATQGILSDTVGFIRDLPHELVTAFRATLEETVHADLLLHIVDASSPARLEQMEQVQQVLAALGAGDIPQILVWNKIDIAPEAIPDLSSHGAVERNAHGRIRRVFLSARTGQGLGLLRAAMAEAAARASTVPQPPCSMPLLETLHALPVLH